MGGIVSGTMDGVSRKPPPPPDPPEIRHLKQLREWRRGGEPDLSLGFMQAAFKRDIARPFKQLQGLTELWEELVPEPLREHTRLEALSRGTLRVTADSASHRYELERLLREGLERRLIERHKGAALQRVRVQQGVIDPPPPEAPEVP